MEKFERKHIDEDFDRRALNYESQSVWTTDLQVASHAISLLADHPLGHILDAGGGTGALTTLITKESEYSSALVVDASAKMLAQVPSDFRTAQSRIEDIPTLGEKFDTILLRQVLHYSEDPDAIIQVLKDLLRDNGRIYIGQIVAPEERSAEWLNNIARRLSPNRKKVWTLASLFALLLSSGLMVSEARVHPFQDNLRSWLQRRVTDLVEEELIIYAQDSLDKQVNNFLRINNTIKDVSFEYIGFMPSVSLHDANNDTRR